MKANRDEKRALRELASKACADVEPTLSTDELLDILEAHRVAKVWSPSLVVSVGDALLPTIGNGWSYKVDPQRDADGIPGGITGTTEPKWPLDPRWPSWEPKSVDDGTVRFVIFRSDALGCWDIAAAVSAAWTLKAGKCSSFTDGGSSKTVWNDSQVYDHCVAMAKKHAPLRFN